MILFTNGNLVHGTGALARRADLLVEGEKIREIGCMAATADLAVVDCVANESAIGSMGCGAS